jgi:hypothetical protein
MTTAAERRCARCGEVKPLTEEFFYWDKTFSRYRTDCKECVKKRQRDYAAARRNRENRRTARWRQKNRERDRANARAYRQANGDQQRATMRRWHEEHQDYYERRQRNGVAHAEARATCEQCGLTFSNPAAWAVCHLVSRCLDPAAEGLIERKTKAGPIWGFSRRPLTWIQQKRLETEGLSVHVEDPG